jgi:hypothetical protein
MLSDPAPQITSEVVFVVSPVVGILLSWSSRSQEHLVFAWMAQWHDVVFVLRSVAQGSSWWDAFSPWDQQS